MVFYMQSIDVGCIIKTSLKRAILFKQKFEKITGLQILHAKFWERKLEQFFTIP